MASYRRSADDLVFIEGTKTAECPTSAITPDIDWLLRQLHDNRMAVKAGGTLYGPDARKWPAWWADAVETSMAAHDHANAILGSTT